jgi:hypothetical protein
VLFERSHALRKAPEIKFITERQIVSNGSIPASGIAVLCACSLSRLSPPPASLVGKFSHQLFQQLPTIRCL